MGNRDSSLRVKRTKHEADHWDIRRFTSTPPIHLHDVELRNRRRKLNVYTSDTE
jgi:hypothetical protein